MVQDLCGINCISWNDKDLIDEMNLAIKHRGPDDDGSYVDQDATLGNVRLSIQDLSSSGHQPMKYEKNGKEFIITFNGEIYNFPELKLELEKKGYSFRTKTDTEIILASFMEWREKCVERFRGMWAFAVYDLSEKIIFLSRDRFGIKPLYYYLGEDRRLIVSSEIRGILTQNSVPRKANDKIMFDYLFYGLADHEENTFFVGIKRLMPGHNAFFDLTTRNLVITQYYCLEEVSGQNDTVDSFRQIFLDSVKQHLISDVPVGSCLSGGIDSSSIVCSMRLLAPTTEITAYSLVFPNQKIDESSYQESVANRCDIERYSTTFGVDDLLRDLEDLVDTQEEPFPGGLGVYGQYLVMQLAHQHNMKVLLDGQGSDEILAGYGYLSAQYYYELLRRLRLATLFKELWNYQSGSKARILKLFGGLLIPDGLKLRILSRDKSYTSQSFRKKYSRGLDKRFRRKFLQPALIEAVTYFPLPALLRYEDKNSMRWSIETRVPFTDHIVIPCAIASSTSKIRNGITKYALRQAMKSELPKEIFERRDKLGFATPERELAESQHISKTVEKIITSDSFKSRPYWDWQRIWEQYVHNRSGPANRIFSGEEIWRIIIAELWLRHWIDGHDILPSIVA